MSLMIAGRIGRFGPDAAQHVIHPRAGEIDGGFSRRRRSRPPHQAPLTSDERTAAAGRNWAAPRDDTTDAAS
jgi:hypothetical protein